AVTSGDLLSDFDHQWRLGSKLPAEDLLEVLDRRAKSVVEDLSEEQSGLQFPASIKKGFQGKRLSSKRKARQNVLKEEFSNKRDFPGDQSVSQSEVPTSSKSSVSTEETSSSVPFLQRREIQPTDADVQSVQSLPQSVADTIRFLLGSQKKPEIKAEIAQLEELLTAEQELTKSYEASIRQLQKDLSSYKSVVSKVESSMVEALAAKNSRNRTLVSANRCREKSGCSERRKIIVPSGSSLSILKEPGCHGKGKELEHRVVDALVRIQVRQNP
ncbi:unnamed protein product, partial [Brassica oleracea]